LDYSSNPGYTALLPVSVKTIALVVLPEEKPRLMNTPHTKGLLKKLPRRRTHVERAGSGAR
jgi:hypothetical protein